MRLTAVELGVRTWLNANSGRARALNVAPIDPGNPQRSTLAEFITATGVTEEQLHDWGTQARARGCCEDTEELRYLLVHATDKRRRRTVSGYRQVRGGWDRVDGTVPQSDADSAQRYLRVPRWSSDRCAVDAMWSLAICMDVFRTQADQQDWRKLGQMARVPALVRNIMLREVGLMTGAQRAGFRDLIAQELQRVDPDEFEPGRLWDLGRVLQVCFSTVPQLSYTQITTTVCCDGQHRIVPPDRRSRRDTGIDLTHAIYGDGKTGQDGINDYFGLTPYAGEDELEPCSNGAACRRQPQSQIAIIDRMPPMLMVLHTGNLDSEGHIDMLAPKMVRFHHHQRGPQEATYLLQGFVVQVNHNHFTVRWLMRRGDESVWMEWDSLRSETAREIEFWNTGLVGKNKKGHDVTHIVVVFYSRDFDG